MNVIHLEDEKLRRTAMEALRAAGFDEQQIANTMEFVEPVIKRVRGKSEEEIAQITEELSAILTEQILALIHVD